MQMVIDIPENWEIRILNLSDSEIMDFLYTIVRNGTQLPENHGDLIDRDKLEPDCYELEIHDGDDWRNEYCGVSLMQLQHYADVIIPATKENNE